MSGTFDFDNILSSIGQIELPPLHLWQPELSGDIDISIDEQGVWRHCGEPFSRLQIPKMFARILCREGDEYYLKTPVEKWRIQVGDVPFYFIHLQEVSVGEELQLRFVSTTEDIVTLDAQHELRIQLCPKTQAPSPYLHVRHGMEGKLSRNLFYQLVEMGRIDEEQQKVFISSAGREFCLGEF